MEVQSVFLCVLVRYALCHNRPISKFSIIFFLCAIRTEEWSRKSKTLRLKWIQIFFEICPFASLCYTCFHRLGDVWMVYSSMHHHNRFCEQNEIIFLCAKNVEFLKFAIKYNDLIDDMSICLRYLLSSFLRFVIWRNEPTCIRWDRISYFFFFFQFSHFPRIRTWSAKKRDKLWTANNKQNTCYIVIYTTNIRLERLPKSLSCGRNERKSCILDWYYSVFWKTLCFFVVISSEWGKRKHKKYTSKIFSIVWKKQ